jgi:hypothetical protein
VRLFRLFSFHAIIYIYSEIDKMFEMFEGKKVYFIT